MKKIVSFALANTGNQALAPKEFRKVDGGFEVDQVIFSTACNRNKYYFQVSKLMGYENKLEKLGSNMNHDLSLTNNQYIPSSFAGYVRLWAVWSDGELEIRGTFRFSDQRLIDRMDEFTGPSIELMVDENTAIISDKGEYYEDFEWIGTAQLTGKLAGMGNARNISEFREFDLNLNPIIQTIIMTEDQVKTLLAEQATQLTADFTASIEAQFKAFQEATAEPVAPEATEGEATEATVPTEAPTEATADEDVTGDEVTEDGVTEDEVVTEVVTPEATVEAEVDESIKQVEHALKDAITSRAKAFKGVKGSESLLDPSDADGDVKENTLSLRERVISKVKNIQI